MGILSEDDMAGLLTAEHVVICLHVLIDISVTDSRLLIADAALIKGLVETEVTHNRSNYGV